MKGRQIRALALSCLLAVTLPTVPAAAAPNRDDGGGRTIAPIERAIKTISNFVMRILDELGLPKP